MNNELVKPDNLTPQEFGNLLLSAAQESIKNRRLKESVSYVEAALADVENCDNQIAWFQSLREKALKKIEAIKAGEFTFDRNSKIVYNDVTLNQ